MDPQNPQPNPQPQPHLNPNKIIQMMRITKKSDPLFKPLKKLKNALESVGYEKISMEATKCVIVFHFGLGNQVDLGFILKMEGADGMGVGLGQGKHNPILPGRSYCYLTFPNSTVSQTFLNQNTKQILPQIPAYHCQLIHQNLTRVLICLYHKEQALDPIKEELDLEDAPLHYKEGEIPGMAMVQEFLTKKEEMELLREIDAGEWERLNNRRVQHYGYEFKYGRNQIDKQQKFQKPMPNFILKTLAKLQQLPFLPSHSFDQLTINDYFPGDGIPSHFDTHSPFEQHFVAISLLSGLVMDWRKYDGTEKQVYLPARSLMVFSGEGRYAWMHGIACRKLDKVGGEVRHRSRRISITLRKIKFTPCHCPYYFYCDSQGYDQSTMKKNNPLLLKYLAETTNSKKLQSKKPEQIYKMYVLDAYKGFGFDFHNKSIKIVEEMIINCFQEHKERIELMAILDVGCGNGQYREFLDRAQFKTHFHYIGIQICETMKPFDDKVHMDGLSLAFRAQSFDLVLCVAVLHHLTTQEQRLRMLEQLRKACGKDGRIVVSVFGHQQKVQVYKEQDILLDYCVSQSKLNKQEGKAMKEEEGRVERRGKVYQRYYHLFQQQQLRKLLKAANLQILNYETDKQNIVILCKPLL